jgi:hypothetical protein
MVLYAHDDDVAASLVTKPGDVAALAKIYDDFAAVGIVACVKSGFFKVVIRINTALKELVFTLLFSDHLKYRFRGERMRSAFMAQSELL